MKASGVTARTTTVDSGVINFSCHPLFKQGNQPQIGMVLLPLLSAIFCLPASVF
jgi:hypothetical protein